MYSSTSFHNHSLPRDEFVKARYERLRSMAHIHSRTASSGGGRKSERARGRRSPGAGVSGYRRVRLLLDCAFLFRLSGGDAPSCVAHSGLLWCYSFVGVIEGLGYVCAFVIAVESLFSCSSRFIREPDDWLNYAVF